MASDILVSIVCNAYNHAAYIRECLESLVAQKADLDYEILVQDDASTDNTTDVIREFEARCPRLVVAESTRQHGAEPAVPGTGHRHASPAGHRHRGQIPNIHRAAHRPLHLRGPDSKAGFQSLGATGMHRVPQGAASAQEACCAALRRLPWAVRRLKAGQAADSPHMK